MAFFTGILQHPDGTVLKQLQPPPRGPREMQFYSMVSVTGMFWLQDWLRSDNSICDTLSIATIILTHPLNQKRIKLHPDNPGSCHIYKSYILYFIIHAWIPEKHCLRRGKFTHRTNVSKGLFAPKTITVMLTKF